MSRAWLFRASVTSNLLLVIYLALYSSSTSSPSENNVPVLVPFTPDSAALHAKSGPPGKNTDLLLSDPSQLQPLLQEQGSNSVSVGNSPEDGGSGGGNGVNNKPEVRSSDGGVVWDGDDSALGEGIAADLVRQ